MANGDKASAKGWSTFPNTQAHSLGYDDINYALDRLADEVDARTLADAAKLDKALIVVSATPLTSANAVGTLRFW